MSLFDTSAPARAGHYLVNTKTSIFLGGPFMETPCKHNFIPSPGYNRWRHKKNHVQQTKVVEANPGLAANPGSIARACLLILPSGNLT